MTTASEKGWKAHAEEQRSAWLRLTPAQRLAWLEDAKRFAEAVTIPIVAPSLGGVETLVTMPAATSHAGLTPEERLEVGVADGLIRVSMGVEGTEDLVADFEAALATI